MSRGGTRPGAGRKCVAPEQKRVGVTISVSSNTAKMLRELRDGRVAVNEILEDRIQTLHQDVFGIPK